MARTYQLTAEQSAIYERGGWSSFRIEETIIEDLDRHNITEPVTVLLDTGEGLFAVYKGTIA